MPFNWRMDKQNFFLKRIAKEGSDLRYSAWIQTEFCLDTTICCLLTAWLSWFDISCGIMVSFTLIVRKHINRIGRGKKTSIHILSWDFRQELYICNQLPVLTSIKTLCGTISNSQFWIISKSWIFPHHSSSDSVLVTQHHIKPVLGPRLCLVFHRISLWLSAVTLWFQNSPGPRSVAAAAL